MCSFNVGLHLGATNTGCDIQQHLQSMFYLLRQEETLKMAVKLETVRTGRTRYLVVVSRSEKYRIQNQQQSPNHIAQSTRLNYSSPSIGSEKQSFLYSKSNISGNSKCVQNSNTINSQKYIDTSTIKRSDTLKNCDISSAYENEFCNRDSVKCHPTINNVNQSSGDIEESCLLGIDCNEKTTVGLVLRILADTSIRLDGDGGFSVSVYGRTHIFKPVSVQAMWSALQTLHKVSAKARSSNYYPGGPSHEWVSYYEDRIESDRSCLNEWHTMDSIESRRPPSPDALRNKPTEREDTEQVIRNALKEIMISVDLDEVTSKYIRGRLEEHLDMDLGEFKSFIDQEMLVILGQMDAPTEIFDHVYLGSEWNASNLEELQKNEVHHILNVTREIDNFFPGMFDYFNVRVYDDEKTNLLKHWDNTFKYISRARKEGSKVLVHCKMGVSRSASVVIAYAMKAYNWSFSQALKHVKKKRNCVKPNKSFLNQLETYQGILDAMKNKEKLQRSKSETNLRSVKEARMLPGSEPTPLIQALNAAEKKEKKLFERERKKIGRRPKTWSPDHVEDLVLLPKQHSQSLENLAPERKEEKTKNVRLPCSNGQNYSVSQNQVVHLHENSSGSVPSVKWIVSELEAHKIKAQTKKKKLCTNIIDPDLQSTSLNKEIWDPGESPNLEYVNIYSNSRNLVKNTNLLCDSPAWASSAQFSHRTPAANLALLETKEKISSKKRSEWSTVQKDTDLFSAQLDHVFDCEERIQNRQRRISSVINTPVFEQSKSDVIFPRQNSWSSIDSAVILNYPGEIRNNISWSSADSRIAPVRNSSLGSYDVKKIHNVTNNFTQISNQVSSEHSMLNEGGVFFYNDDIHPNVVKRTKKKGKKSSIIQIICGDNQVECNDNTVNRAIEVSSASNKIRQQLLDHQIRKNRYNSEEMLNVRNQSLLLNDRLSASAPETSSMESISNKLSQTNFCWEEKLKPNQSEDNTNEIAHKGKVICQSFYGIVQNLKMNFESNVDTKNDCIKKIKSLPSSPVATHPDKSYGKNFLKLTTPNINNVSEEINVKGLVNRYEVTKTNQSSSLTDSTSSIKPRPRSVFETRQSMSSFSKPLMINHSTNISKIDEYRRPPVRPNVKNPIGNIPTMTGALVAKNFTCKSVQQHGKTHPLTRLGLPKQMFNTAAYNTM